MNKPTIRIANKYSKDAQNRKPEAVYNGTILEHSTQHRGRMNPEYRKFLDNQIDTVDIGSKYYVSYYRLDDEGSE